MRPSRPTPVRALRILRSTVVERMGEAVRWRALGVLFLAGGLLTLGTLVLPTPAGTDALGIVVLCVAALITGGVLLGFSEHLPSGDLALSLVLGFGTVLISGASWMTGEASSALTLMYIWVGFDAFFFLGRRAAAGHMTFVGALYAVVLLTLPDGAGGSAGRWLMLVGTMVVVGVLADILQERTARLVARLEDVARSDALTGLLNRRGFEELMARELERAARVDRPVSLLVCDLDHFKAVNDSFGHRQGDRALQDFAALVARDGREGDGAARIGGEEFAVILPDTDAREAYLVAERLRRRVRAEVVQLGRPLSVSIGVATGPQHGADADALLHSADQALYLAKRLGRDRSVSFSAEVAAALREPAAHAAAVEQLTAVLVLAETLDLRDAGTAAHSESVGRYAEAIARELAFEPHRVERVRLAGLLHDVGKIGVPDGVLTKPGALTDAEWAEVRKHPELGARILAGANLDDISAWVLAHHERPDGRGYPAGLVADEVPLEARVLAVADSFEAMVSDRPYRPGMPLPDAVDELRRHTGTQFDPRVVEAFLETLRRAGTLAPTPAQAGALVE